MRHVIRCFRRGSGASPHAERVTVRTLLACAAIVVTACAHALHEPPPISEMAPAPGGRGAADLLREADATWRRRGEPGQAAVAQDLYLQAAVADERGVAALLGAMRAMTFRIEREREAPVRATLAQQQVELGQWCERRAPSDPACDYRLALALGQQARERPSTGRDAVEKMVKLLRRAIAGDPALDSGGPHRALALVLLRAPSWPLGPGDPEAALQEARAAVQLFPDVAGNQLAMAEALERNEQPEPARAAYDRAVVLAAASVEAGDPDADRALAEARAGAERNGGR
jgi:tetratricopeptide (TPR) repeat protein